MSARVFAGLMLVGLLLWVAAVPAQELAEDEFGYAYIMEHTDSFTPEELNAIDIALWAGNMTRTDLTYKKDYTEGYGCFPVVTKMMQDPLMIAYLLDWRMAEQDEELFGSLSYGGYYSLWQACSFSGDKAFDESRLWNGEREEDRIDFTGLLPEDYGYQSFITSADSLAQFTEHLAQLGYEQLELHPDAALIRDDLISALAWHDLKVSDIGAAESGEEEVEADLEELYEIANTTDLLTAVDFCSAVTPIQVILESVPIECFPKNQPLTLDTTYGRIVIGTPKDDYYEGDFVVLIEPGGNDTYHNCRIGAAYGQRSYGPRLAPTGEAVGASADYSPLGNGQFGYFIDLGGDDFYDCADVNITLGAAVLGVGVFSDCGGGDDRYYAGSCSLGAAMGGIASFHDDGGSDFYSGKVFTQGAAGFGVGIMADGALGETPVFDTAEGNDAAIDDYDTGKSDVDTHNLMDNDVYTAWANAQAFARPRGVALCANRRGNETYHAGGVYLHAPLFGDRYQSFSQGFAIGERGIDWAGGIALLVDYEGNDRYLGDIYNQGVGYWYGAGLLWDGAGHDTYEMTQYGQGSGIHLAVGGLIDVSGNDSYIMHSGLGQGSSHDLAVSILHDRGGNDRYHGNTTCNGGALAGACALFIDRSGNDTYAGRPNNSVNYTDGRRVNAGVFVDLEGDDVYSREEMADDQIWRLQNISMGADSPPWPEGEEALEEDNGDVAATAEEEAEEPEEPPVPIPEICSYEGELTQEVFDELWEISIRWAVGDNRYIVPVARERLIAFGPVVLPYLSAVMDDSNSGLALRAFQDIYTALYEVDAAAVEDVLRENAVSDDVTRRTNALYLIGEMKLNALEDVVVAFLDDPEASLVRRAIGVLGSIESHAADDRLVAILNAEDSSEELLKAALTTLTDLEVECYASLHPLLSHPLFTVREQLVKQFAAHWEAYEARIVEDFGTTAQRVWVTVADATEELDEVPLTLPVPSTRAISDEEIHAAKQVIRSLMGVLTQIEQSPLDVSESLGWLLRAEDWGVRGDAVRVVKHWQVLAVEDEDLAAQIEPLVTAMEALAAMETEPFVLYALEN